LLFIGDDWAEDHHDVELQDEGGRVLARRRLRKGSWELPDYMGWSPNTSVGWIVSGGRGEADAVVIGIETDRGPWVEALIASG
jgi:hypothetical protein